MDFSADPPDGMVLAWFFRTAFLLNVLLLPVSLVTLALGVWWRRRPASPSVHRWSGKAMGGHLSCALVFGALAIAASSEPGLPREWAYDIAIFVFVVGPALCGTLAWYAMFRRPVHAVDHRPFLSRDVQ